VIADKSISSDTTITAAELFNVQTGVCSNHVPTLANCKLHVKDTADGVWYEFGTGIPDPGLSSSSLGSVTITYNTYSDKDVQKRM